MKPLERMRAIADLSGVSSTEAAVLWALALYADERDECFPSYETIGKAAKLSERSAIRTLQALIMRGLVTATTRQTSAGRRTSNLYRLLLSSGAARGVPQRHPSDSPKGDSVSPLKGDHTSPLEPLEGCQSVTPEGDTASPPEGDSLSPDLIREELITGEREEIPLASRGKDLAPPNAFQAPLAFEPVNEPSRSKRDGRDAEIAAVFEAWRAEGKTHRPNRTREPILDASRRKAIAKMLARFDVDTLKRAAVGIWRDEWHRGGNPEGKWHTGIGLAMRDAEHVERFAELGTPRRERPIARAPVAQRAAKPTPAEREESARILRGGLEALDAKLDADRQAVNGGARAAR